MVAFAPRATDEMAMAGRVCYWTARRPTILHRQVGGHTMCTRATHTHGKLRREATLQSKMQRDMT